MTKICIMGSGSFGKAVAEVLKSKGYPVTLWNRHLNAEECMKDSQYVVYAVPSQSFREVFTNSYKYLEKDAAVINLAKGIETDTLLRMAEVAESICPGVRYAALSGPSHAEEIAIGMPTTIVACSEDDVLAKEVQNLFMTDFLRVYTNNDMTGVELGGALKNVIALCCGVGDGAGFGDNAKAALMTRGLAEITRLALAMGARAETLAGLTGIGDLIVTCTSMHSRNRRCGILIGQGKSPEEAKAEVQMVVEGIPACIAAHKLSLKMGIEMPIVNNTYRLLNGEISVDEALTTLMQRPRKGEF